ncbi:MAG TPA: biopolymer transporter ExbD [Kofleriaceae bacterium]|jgi:biopolymer transport protein TolR|nr:biopolymer transporter ExbD [Kofleriaceae bacterium]
MSTGGNKGGVQSEINVTPLIDVLLVLLIIFLVVMPIMMKMETLEIPRKITDTEAPDPNSTLLTVKVRVTGELVFSDNDKETVIQPPDLMSMLRPKLEAAAARGAERVIFVDFEDGVLWAQVVTTMDSIRSLAADVNHDEVKVALKLKEDLKPQ